MPMFLRNEEFYCMRIICIHTGELTSPAPLARPMSAANSDHTGLASIAFATRAP